MSSEQELADLKPDARGDEGIEAVVSLLDAQA